MGRWMGGGWVGWSPPSNHRCLRGVQRSGLHTYRTWIYHFDIPAKVVADSGMVQVAFGFLQNSDFTETVVAILQSLLNV